MFRAVDIDPPALTTAIRAVHAGHVLLNPDVARLLTAEDARSAGTQLTARKRDVLGELAQGRSNREITRRLTLSEKTVKTHVSAVLGKLGVADRTHATLHAVRTGLADGDADRSPRTLGITEMTTGDAIRAHRN